MAEGMMLRCEQVRDEAAGIRAFTLRLLDPLGSDRLEPGRYLSLDCPDPGGQVRSRCYSIVARPTLDTIEVVIKRGGHNGVSDQLFHQVQPGSTLSGGAIDGDITASRLLHHGQVVMLANGIGATLPMALIRSMAGLREQGRPTPRVSLLLCNPTLASIPFLAELLRLDRRTIGSTCDFTLLASPSTDSTGISMPGGRVRRIYGRWACLARW